MKTFIGIALSLNVVAVMAAGAVDLSLLGPVANISAAGVLGWYLYYDTRFGKPSLQKQHQSHVDSLQAAFLRESEQQRDDYQQQSRRLGEFYAQLVKVKAGGSPDRGQQGGGGVDQAPGEGEGGPGG